MLNNKVIILLIFFNFFNLINGTNIHNIEVAAPLASAPGSLSIGSTKYNVPNDAIFVSPNGNDLAQGTKIKPLKTVTKALNVASKGATIVLRKGIYHEHIKIQKEGITIQSYPGEEVYFDGSTELSQNGWKKEGDLWVYSNWTVEFDSSPTFTQGKPDRTDQGWQNVNPSYPMAAHPDQLFINDVSKVQVGSKDEVSRGKFFVDYDADKIYIGEDPFNKKINASDINMCMEVQAPKVTICGLGVRRYAPSVFNKGAIRVDGIATNFYIENVEIKDNATAGIDIGSKGSKIQNITSINNGMLGVGVVYADGIKIDKAYIANNNTENFNQGPIACGMKITRTQNITISNSIFTNNNSSGLWLDEDCYNATLVCNEITNNKRHGLIYELSSIATIANNRINHNAVSGLFLMNSDHVQIWNNSITDSDLPLQIKQDERTPLKDRTWAFRLPEDYPNITWYVSDIYVANNIIGLPRNMGSGQYGGLVSIRDESFKRSGDEMRITMNGNVYYRTGLEGRPNLIQWSLKKPNVQGWNNFKTLDEFKKATLQDARSVQITTNLDQVDKDGYAISSVKQNAENVALAILDSVAKVSDLPAGEIYLGPVKTRLGNLDNVSKNSISGWAWNKDAPSSSVNIKICIYNSANNKVAEYLTSANKYRADIKNQGFGTGNYAFNYNMDWEKFLPGKYRVALYVVDGSGDIPLPNVKYFTK